jgi:ribosomal protein S18 acetylase RimI-like enzyme
MSLLGAVGLFGSGELDFLRGLLESHFEGQLGDGHTWIVDDNDVDQPVAIAYYAPERLTEGTWNLYLIAVHPDQRRMGRAESLIRHIEGVLAQSGARLLLVETAFAPLLAGAWALYKKCGYTQEARIANFYAAGVDKLIFTKPLATAPDSVGSPGVLIQES